MRCIPFPSRWPAGGATVKDHTPKAPRSVIRATGRRWYVVVAVLMLFVPLALHANSVRGVYWMKYDVVFLLPAGASDNNALRNGASNIVFYAAMIQRQYASTHKVVKVQTNGAPLYGSGVRSGVSMYLPDTGGQWQSNFNRPAITVEVVGETEAEANLLASTTAREIREMALKPQADLGVVPKAYISTTTNPERPAAGYVDVRNKRAVGAIALVAFGAATGLAVLVDVVIFEILSRRQRKATSRLSVAESGVLLRERIGISKKVES